MHQTKYPDIARQEIKHHNITLLDNLKLNLLYSTLYIIGYQYFILWQRNLMTKIAEDAT
jgi:hypothetical protein